MGKYRDSFQKLDAFHFKFCLIYCPFVHLEYYITILFIYLFSYFYLKIYLFNAHLIICNL